MLNLTHARSKSFTVFSQLKLGDHFRIPGSWAEDEVYVTIPPLISYISNKEVETNAVNIRTGEIFNFKPKTTVRRLIIDAIATEIADEEVPNENSV